MSLDKRVVFSLLARPPPPSGHTTGTGVLWIYGDSVNRLFFEALQPRPLCTQVFRACYYTPVWVYILHGDPQKETDLRLEQVRIINKYPTEYRFEFSYCTIIVRLLFLCITQFYKIKCKFNILSSPIYAKESKRILIPTFLNIRFIK